MEQVIKIDGKDVGFKATALTPRLYRHLIGRDMISDMSSLRKAYAKVKSLPKNATQEEREAAQMSTMDLEVFENAAWIMARQYDASSALESPNDWLDTFNTFSIYEVLPVILKLWAINNQTTSKPKKKFAKQ